MTLDIAKFISNAVRAQAKMQHLDVTVKTVSAKRVPKSVAGIITETYGEKYLLDADYVSFFWGHISKEDIKRLFSVVDKALGTSANKLTNTDFKKITVDGAVPQDKPEDDSQAEKPAESADEPEEEQAENPEDKAKDIEDDVAEVLKEDDEGTEEAKPLPPVSHFFLKITSK